ncbi:MAG: carboxypeptidase regulatory-like domain-containing protein [Eubacterium sp.]|nr:carboxypeptidase regulatory-like domain-containing protein [Eubacterium sp.]
MHHSKLQKSIVSIAAVLLAAVLLSSCGRRSAGEERNTPDGNRQETAAAPSESSLENTVEESKKTELWGTVTGRVVDSKTGKTLVNVTYTLVADEAPTDKVTVASDGSFSFEAKGHYEITFEKLGYDPVTLGYEVKAGETLEYGDIAMTEAVDMSGFILTDDHQTLIRFWLQTMFEDANNGYVNPQITKTVFNKDEIPSKVWSRNMYLYIGFNKLNDSRISSFTAGNYGEVFNTLSEEDARSVLFELTGFKDNAYCDEIIDYLRSCWQGDGIDISTVAIVGDAGYFNFRDITGWKIEKDTLIVDGMISELGGAKRQILFTATFSVSDPDAPMPWKFEKLEVNAGSSGSSGNSSSSGSNSSGNSSSQSNKGTYTTTDTITMRPGTSLDSGEIMKIPSGSTVTVLDFGSRGFYHVQYGGKTGYALASYMTPNSGAEVPSAYSTFYVVNYTCIYGWPRPSNAEEVTALAPGDKLEYLEDSENGTWFVRFNGYLYGFYDYSQGGSSNAQPVASNTAPSSTPATTNPSTTTTPVTPAPSSTTPSDNPAEDTSWQQGYYDFLYLDYTWEENAPTFALCYIDDDNIPELAIGFNGTDRFAQVELFCWYEGKVVKLGDVGWFSSFSYKEKGNLICNNQPVGSMKSSILVQEIKKGKLETVYQLQVNFGEYSMGKSTLKSCSEEEYNAKYYEYFPKDKTKSTPDLILDGWKYHCTVDSISLILTNPKEVTL